MVNHVLNTCCTCALQKYPPQQLETPGWGPSEPPQQQRAYSHQPQVLHILHQSPRATGDDAAAAEYDGRGGGGGAHGPGHQQQFDIIAPPPLSAAQMRPPPRPVQSLSQYDIARERDPELRAQLKADYAATLNEGWSKQVWDAGSCGARDVLLFSVIFFVCCLPPLPPPPTH